MSCRSASAGVVPHTAGKLFFFIAYDKFHSRLFEYSGFIHGPNYVGAGRRLY